MVLTRDISYFTSVLLPYNKDLNLIFSTVEGEICKRVIVKEKTRERRRENDKEEREKLMNKTPLGHGTLCCEYVS